MCRKSVYFITSSNASRAMWCRIELCYRSVSITCKFDTCPYFIQVESLRSYRPQLDEYPLEDSGEMLHEAIKADREDFVDWVLRRGDARRALARVVDGHVALHEASIRGNPRIVRLLLSDRLPGGAWADRDARTRGSDYTPLMVAVENGHDAVVQVLVGAGADLDAQTRWARGAGSPSTSGGGSNVSSNYYPYNYYHDYGDAPPARAGGWAGRRDHSFPPGAGQTALHRAARRADPNTLHLLLVLGARWDIPNWRGETADDVALRYHRRPHRRILLEFSSSSSYPSSAASLSSSCCRAPVGRDGVVDLGRGLLRGAARDRADAVRYFLDLRPGLRSTARDERGYTALQVAASRGAADAVRVLLLFDREHHASPQHHHHHHHHHYHHYGGGFGAGWYRRRRRAAADYEVAWRLAEQNNHVNVVRVFEEYGPRRGWDYR